MQSVARFLPTRRGALTILAVLALAASACAPAAPSPTAPPKPTEAPKPAEAKPAAKPTEAPAAKPAPATSPAAKPTEKPAAKAITLPPPETKSLKFAVAALETTPFTIKFAQDLGLYKKYGIEDVEVLYIETQARTAQALASGQVVGAATGAGTAINSIKAGEPIILVAMYSNTQTDSLVTAADVKTAADLKGKKVAVASFGGDSHASVLLALKALNLAERDVTVTQIGGQSARIAALAAGSVSAAPVDVTLDEEMKKQGFNILVRIPDSKVQIAKTGLMFRKEFMDKNPNTVLAVVAANLEAMQNLYTNTDRAIESYARWTQQDPARAGSIIRTFLQFPQRDLRWTKEGMEILKEVTAKADPAVAEVDVTKSYTFQFLDRLREMGFNDAVGVPKM